MGCVASCNHQDSSRSEGVNIFESSPWMKNRVIFPPVEGWLPQTSKTTPLKEVRVVDRGLKAFTHEQWLTDEEIYLLTNSPEG